MNIETIILDGMKNGKTYDEINKELEEAGSTVRLNANKKGNAFLDTGTGSLDPVIVENGKVTNGGGIPRQDEVIYDGKVWWLDDDGVTLIAKPAEKEPWWAKYHTYGGLVPWQEELPPYIPDEGMMHRPEYAGQKVKKGKLLYRYDAEGNATYEPISMRDYDEDHNR